MAPFVYFTFRKVLLLYVVFILFTSTLLFVQSESQIHSRRLMESQRDDQSETKPSKNPSKVKPNFSSKNQTKLIKSNLSMKNQTKLSKTTNSTKFLSKFSNKIELKKNNSISKSSNSTKSGSLSSKKFSDLLKENSSKNKTTKPMSKNKSHLQIEKNQKHSDPESHIPNKNQKDEKKTNPENLRKQSQKPGWIDEDEDGEEDDFISDFRYLPSKFHQSLIPDLEKFSTSSKAYITKANKQITRGFQPIVGSKYASTIASIASFAFILFPLIIISLIFNRIKAYFSLQKLLIFIHVYLSIYFFILSLSSLATGLEPLRFFHATSQSTYVCIHILQMLGYVLYLLLLLMYLILVFSTNCGLGSRMLGLGQTFVGFAIGLHYYMAVFHRMVLHQPPKTNWQVHGLYALCFSVICMFAGAERKKKAYLEDSGEEGKKS